ncbi:MAG: NUDIX hydrolase [Fibrobacterota bacterium]
MPLKNDSLFERVRKRETLYNGCYLKLEKLTVDCGNGKTGVREIVHVRNAVAVLPVDARGRVTLVRQHRPAIGRTILEVPAGVMDPGESPAACARRECAEETGLRPRKLTKLISYAHAEGYSTGFITLFLGTDLKKTGALKLDATECVEPVLMTFEKLMSLIKKGTVIDSKTLLSALLSRSLLRKGRHLTKKRRLS